MIRRRPLVALLALGSQFARAQAGPLPTLRERLTTAPVVRGEFEQRKTVKGFRHALTSRGDFVVARGRGVLWRTQEPFAQSLLVTPDRLIARRTDGATASRLDATREPALQAINQTLFALMGADLDVLARRFDVATELRGAQAWRLVLLPRDTQVSAWIERVELEGDRFVHQVQISEKSGDATLIRFFNQQPAEALTADEEAAFA
ncbi:MAG: outer membrane lipoprotein carrier protein LolA [Betaproteobacteria bacterium]|nr:outer membrane lipoprotein carrier protein LolA [Betaproteobacteria bacterium]MBK8106483.1 outer membrane lipoprotein carrier protein LolA [Betaproteobacteria bacterium]